MKYKIVFHPEATQEYVDAYEWYEQKQSGMGERFILSVDEAIADIVSHPATGRSEASIYRVKTIKIFPYIILYEVIEKRKEIYIEAIYHGKRNPKNKFKRSK